MKSQSWMIKAFILGMVFFIAALFVKPVGVSTQFSVLSGMIQTVVEPDVIVEDVSRESGYISSNPYYDRSEGKLAASIKHPINYEFVFVLAIPLGAYLTYLLLKKKNGDQGLQLETQVCGKDIQVTGKRKHFIKGVLPNFIGGFLLLYGARMADGCTSGHMMSGMMQGSVSGYIFAASVFAVAIPTAIFIEKNEASKGGIK